jgi:hypothetical protein
MALLIGAELVNSVFGELAVKRHVGFHGGLAELIEGILPRPESNTVAHATEFPELRTQLLTRSLQVSKNSRV